MAAVVEVGPAGDGDEGTGRLLIVSGPSGAGKTSAVTRAIEMSGGSVGRVLTCTTRRPRAGEVDGVDYRFMDRDSFERALGRGAFAEHAEVHGNRYGTLITDIEGAMRRFDVAIIITDPAGARAMSGLFPGSVTAFIDAADDELARRLAIRGDEPSAIKRRMADASDMRAHMGDYGIVLESADRDGVDALAGRLLDACGVEAGRDDLEGIAGRALTESRRGVPILTSARPLNGGNMGEMAMVGVKRPGEPITFLDVPAGADGIELEALQWLVGGNIEFAPGDVGDGVDAIVNDEFLFDGSLPNCVLYADRGMEEAGLLSPIDGASPIKEGDAVCIVHGTLVCAGYDPETGSTVGLTPDQAISLPVELFEDGNDAAVRAVESVIRGEAPAPRGSEGRTSALCEGAADGARAGMPDRSDRDGGRGESAR